MKLSFKNRNVRIVTYIIAGVVIWCILAYLYGPQSEHGLQERIKRLQQDSIELTKSYDPRDLDKSFKNSWDAVDNLNYYGDPFHGTDRGLDSVRIMEHPRTAKLAMDNKHRADSIREVVNYLRRLRFIPQLQEKLLEKSLLTKVKVRSSDSLNKNMDIIEIYSLRYKSDDEIQEDINEYYEGFKHTGFKSVKFAYSPSSSKARYIGF